MKRTILQYALLSTAAILSSGFISLLPAQPSRETPELKVEVKKVTVEIGLEKPFQAIQLTDSHICKLDNRDYDRLKSRFNKRVSQSNGIYREILLMDQLHYAESIGSPLLLHTGDFMDMFSEAGCDYVAAIFKRYPNCIACVGNHEFINVVGKASTEDEARAELFAPLSTAFPNDIVFASKVVNGVDFVAFDNVNCNITKEVFRKMKNEVAKGLPIVILCHIPLYIPETIQSRLDKRGGIDNKSGASVMGAPREITDRYVGDDEKLTGPKYEQRAEKITLEFVEWLRQQSNVKAIFCGHNHKTHREQFSPSCTQYTTNAAYKGYLNLITFK